MEPSHSAPPKPPAAEAGASGNAPDELRRSLLSSVSWTGAGTLFNQVLVFGRSVILARLLSPRDYGLWGMAALVVAALTVFTQFNLSSSLIAGQFHSDDQRRTYLDTVWTADLLRRALVLLLLAGLAHPAAAYFGDPRVFTILLIVSASPLLSGFQNIGLVQLQKDLNLRALAIQQQGADVIGTAATIAIAYFVRNFWALVASQMINAAAGVALSYMVCSYRPRWRLDRSALRAAFRFGKHMFVVGILTYITTQFDNLVVGHYLGAAVLGVYLLAYRLASMPVDILASVFSTVLFPFYAKIHAVYPERMAEALLKAANSGMILLVLLVAPVYFAGAEVIHFIYGAQWDAAIPLLSVLVLVGFFRGSAQTVSPFLLGTSRPHLDAMGKVVEVCVFIPLTLVLVRTEGALGAAVAGAVSYAIAFALRLGFVLRYCGARRLWLLARLLKPALLGGGCALVLMPCGNYVGGVCTAVLFEVVFCGAALWVHPEVRREAWLAAGRLVRSSGSKRMAATR